MAFPRFQMADARDRRLDAPSDFILSRARGGYARHDKEETERALVYRMERAKLAGTETAFAMVLTARFLSMVHGVPR